MTVGLWLCFLQQVNKELIDCLIDCLIKLPFYSCQIEDLLICQIQYLKVMLLLFSYFKCRVMPSLSCSLSDDIVGHFQHGWACSLFIIEQQYYYTTTWAETWRRIWGGPKKFSRPNFRKNFHFQGKNFWWPFFSNRPGSSDFFFLFPHFPNVYYVKCRIWPFPHKKNTIFHSVHAFTHIRQHYFSK